MSRKKSSWLFPRFMLELGVWEFQCIGCTPIEKSHLPPRPFPSGAWTEIKVFQTLTVGDEPEANGRVEGEVLQFKRRLKLLLVETGVNMTYWPCAARHGRKAAITTSKVRGSV